MHDSGSLYSIERLERCDVYFKRSFTQAEATKLPPHLAAKVERYGIFYESVESGDLSLALRVLCEIRARRLFGVPVGTRDIRWWLGLIKRSWMDPISRRMRNKPLVIQDEEVAGEGYGLGETVCFQTRLWSPEETPRDKGVGRTNEMRAGIVRSLKEHFGDRFVGGLMRTGYAQKHYPSLITPHADDRISYLKLLRKCRISVVTEGIHRSIPGKLGESLATARCIVTEDLAYELPSPLQKGTHFLQFQTPEECVAACDHLMGDNAAAAAMQSANREYYRNHGRVAGVVERCLTIASERGRARRSA
jgi:hypothetical protein